MSELRGCPFCGGEAEDGRVFDTNCKNPKCTIYGINFSIDHWQTRPTEDRKNRLIGAFLKRREALKATLSADPSTLENPSGTIEAAIDEIAALRQRVRELETKLRKIASDSILD